MNNLVEYSSTESEDEENEEAPPSKRAKQTVKLKETTKLPMLLSVDKPEEKDSPEEHQMRVRAIPHTEGNWAAHVYIECPLSDNLNSIIKVLLESFKDIHSIDSPHLSLSKTFILRFHWIKSFFSTLVEKLKHSSNKFHLQFSSDVAFYSNEDKTRYFACILASEWCKEPLITIVNRVDLALKEFKLPVYYKDPSMHLSILWKLTEFTPEEKIEISSKVKSLMESHHEVLSLAIDKIWSKCGNKVLEFCLP